MYKLKFFGGKILQDDDYAIISLRVMKLHKQYFCLSIEEFLIINAL
jgi:hypothetical protein